MQVAVPARRSPERPGTYRGLSARRGWLRPVVPAALLEESGPLLPSEGVPADAAFSCGKGRSCPSGEGDQEAAVSSFPVGSGGGVPPGRCQQPPGSAAPAGARAEPRRGAGFTRRLSGTSAQRAACNFGASAASPLPAFSGRPWPCRQPAGPAAARRFPLPLGAVPGAAGQPRCRCPLRGRSAGAARVPRLGQRCVP